MSKILEKAVTESISPGLMAHLYTTKVVSCVKADFESPRPAAFWSA